MADQFLPKLHPDKDGKITYICPYCTKATKESVEKFIAKRGPVEINCDCGKVFSVEIELRNTYRKKLYLDGFYVRADQKGAWGKMTVKNISLGGLGFEAMSKQHELQKGEIIKIDFNLDDAKNTRIQRQVEVRFISGRYIGCQFIKSGIKMDPELGFYMMRQF